MRESISSIAQAEACALRLLLRVERTLQRARSRGWLAAALLMATPASALACPVCGLVGTSDNTWAYQAMSAMLTLLPLAMIGATVWWLARLVARADTERQSATQHIADRAPVDEAETYSVVNSRASGPAKAGHYVLAGPEAKPR